MSETKSKAIQRHAHELSLIESDLDSVKKMKDFCFMEIRAFANEGQSKISASSNEELQGALIGFLKDYFKNKRQNVLNKIQNELNE